MSQRCPRERGEHGRYRHGADHDAGVFKEPGSKERYSTRSWSATPSAGLGWLPRSDRTGSNAALVVLGVVHGSWCPCASSPRRGVRQLQAILATVCTWPNSATTVALVCNTRYNIRVTTKVEKLAIAAYAAPRLRDGSTRRIKTTDRDGMVVREIGDAELAAGMLARAGIELDVQKGVARTHKICPCGRVWTPPRLGGGLRTPDACPQCRAQAVCIGWEGPCPDGAKPNRTSFSPGEMKKRGGGPWRCHRCNMRRTQPERTRKMIETKRRPENREAESERVKAWHASLTTEQKAARTRKVIETTRRPGSMEANAERAKAWHASLTPEQKAVHARSLQLGAEEHRAAIAPTHCKHGHELTEENTEITSRGRRCRTCREQARSTAPQRRAESMRATLGAAPAEVKSERSKRAWETRRARYSPEQLAEQSKRAWDARHAAMPDPEVLAERAKRAWETRRARYGPSGGK